MRRGRTLARRYFPFIVLAAVQALFVVLVPSTATVGGGGTDSIWAGSDSSYQDGSAGPTDGPTGSDAAAVPGSAATGAGGSATGTGSTGSAATSGVGARPPAGGSTGDRSKCAPSGRQQDITTNSPPCVPRWSGDNGGASYRGVTADKVKVVLYRGKSNAQVDAVLRTQGLASTPEEERYALQTFAKFFEKHYEFYGRTIEWVPVYEDRCDLTPPVGSCYRDSAKKIVQDHTPFAVVWPNATVQAELFDELSRQGVVNIGGWHFNAEFNQRLRPYHWDVFMDGTRTARNLAEYWCKKMQGKTASLAGSPTLRNTKRKVGIITQDYEVTRKNAQDFVRFVSGEMCGSPAEVAPPQYTPSDISRAQQTAQTAMEKLQDEGVTTVVLMLDPIGPRFYTQQATSQGYFPEHLLAGSGLIDYDLLGRLYDQAQWVNAFGVGHLGDPVPFSQSDAAKAARDVGVDDVASNSGLLFAYMSLMAAQVQMAGPTLTPANVERGVLSLPPSGGWERTKNPSSTLVKFGPGDYTAIEDSRHTYWDPDAPSKIDGKPGAYIAIANGRRWEIGTWPAGEPRR